MNKAHKIQLNLTKSQEKFMKMSCGVARFTYNWALAKWQEDYKNGIKQDANSLKRHLNSIKREQFPWMLQVGKSAPQYAICNLEKAFKKMWKEKSGYPKFKKKGVKDSFVAVENNIVFKQQNKKIWIPRLGWVKCYEDLRFEGKVNNVVVKRVADKWFAVVNIDTLMEMPAKCESQAVVGIDMGIKSMMVLSDGTVFENPKALKSNLKSLKRLQKGLSRKVKSSSNYQKQKIRVARKHYRISNIRANAIHQATAAIVKKYDKIVIETLKSEQMAKNKNLAQAVYDVSFYEIGKQLNYKCNWHGKELIKADQWFASSKICSCCGNKKEKLHLNERVYNCEKCKTLIDRDLNAAKNLAKYSPTLETRESEACREIAIAISMKQEINYKLNL